MPVGSSEEPFTTNKWKTQPISAMRSTPISTEMGTLDPDAGTAACKRIIPTGVDARMENF